VLLDQELKNAMARAEEAENAVIESAGGSNALGANEYNLRSENKHLLSEIEDTALQLEVSKNENDGKSHGCVVVWLCVWLFVSMCMFNVHVQCIFISFVNSLFAQQQ